MATEWYYQENGNVIGPLLPSALKQLALDGVVSPETFVRRRQDAKWFTARQVQGLFPKSIETEESGSGAKAGEDMIAGWLASGAGPTNDAEKADSFEHSHKIVTKPTEAAESEVSVEEPRPSDLEVAQKSYETANALSWLVIVILGIPILYCASLLWSSSLDRELKVAAFASGTLVTLVVFWFIAESLTLRVCRHLTPGQQSVYKEWCQQNAYRFAYGTENPAMVCPHCQAKGTVSTKTVTQKAGVSGTKATGAILTGGVSLLVTGLSQEQNRTRAHCKNCGATWVF